MIPIFIVFLVCTAAGQCETQDLPWPASRAECDVHGQFFVAEWLAAHPDRELRGGWQCLVGRPA